MSYECFTVGEEAQRVFSPTVSIDAVVECYQAQNLGKCHKPAGAEAVF